MSEDIQGVTRDDLEQLLEDHTGRVVGAVEQVREELKGDIDRVEGNVTDRIDSLEVKIDRIDKRTEEDTTLALKKISVMEREISLIKKSLAVA